MMNTRHKQIMSRTVSVLIQGFLVAILLAVLPVSAVRAEEPVLSDSALFNRANSAYADGEWLEAARYLTAYIHRQTSAYRNSSFFAGQVDAALTFSLDRIDDAEQSLRFDANWWHDQAYGAVQQCADECPGAQVFVSSVAGMTYLPDKPVIDAPSLGASTSYPLVCRGGSEVTFGFVSASSEYGEPYVYVSFTRASAGVGSNWENIDVLQPGQCSWLDRAINHSEPQRLLLPLKELAAKDLNVGWNDGRISSLESSGSGSFDAAKLLHDLESPDVLRTFHSYNDRGGNFVVTGFGSNGSTQGQATSFLVVDVAAGDSLNVRAAAGVQFDIVGRIPRNGRGVEVKGTGTQVGSSLWLPVDYNDLVGWVHSAYLDLENGEMPGSVSLDRTLTVGSQRNRGLDVRLVQRRLRSLGYDTGAIDGWYGPRTAGAVERFQQANGLDANSVVGASTWQHLFATNAIGIP